MTKHSADGALATDSLGDYRFQGMWLDPSGLYYVRARSYDAETGRFLSRDPAVGYVALPESTAPFAFVGNNPWTGRDPSGLFSLRQMGAVVQTIGILAAKAVVYTGNLAIKLIGPAYLYDVYIAKALNVALTFGADPEVLEVVSLVASGLILGRVAYLGIRAAYSGVTALHATIKEWLRRRAARGGPKLLAAPKTVKHHIFNKFRGKSPKSQKYRDFFKQHGIEVDKWTVEIPESLHKGFIHKAGNNWTTRWKRWIDANPHASTKEVYQQAGRMMDEYGLSGVPLVPYR